MSYLTCIERLSEGNIPCADYYTPFSLPLQARPFRHLTEHDKWIMYLYDLFMYLSAWRSEMYG